LFSDENIRGSLAFHTITENDVSSPDIQIVGRRKLALEIYHFNHGLLTPGEDITLTARPKIHSHSQIFSYSQGIFCLPHQPKFSDFFDLCIHWVLVVRVLKERVAEDHTSNPHDFKL